MFYILTAADIHSTPQSSQYNPALDFSATFACVLSSAPFFTFHSYFVSVNEGRYLAGLAAEICHGVC